jgi:outer membrane protein OmpA-like peptidoglycan-associated protein
MKKATKVIICLTGLFLLAFGSLQAQDDAHPAADSSRSVIAAPDGDTTALPPLPTGNADNSVPVRDTTAPQKDNTAPATDTPAGMQDSSTKTSPDAGATAKDGADGAKDGASTAKDGMSSAKDGASTAKDGADGAKADAKPAGDTTSSERTNPIRKLDTRWFISPLLKLQFQDFAFLEKNRKGYLSDAGNLPFFNRGNASFAASAYKNLTGRLSFSADLGLSFGHVTNDNVLISQTKSKTYNLLNASVYYHLLAASYRLQPYITIGFNDLINDASYLSAPIGIGAKFNARKVMVLGQITYGYGLSKNISNTTMYSMGIYIPINNKKHKQLDSIDNSPYNRRTKEDDAKKKDTTKSGSVVINNYITINIDSVLKARGLDGLDGSDGRSARKKSSDDGDDDGSDGSTAGRGGKKRQSGSLSSSMNLEDFSFNDFRMDTVDGKPVIRFVIYFEFNDYGLTGKAFGSIDKVIGHLRHNTELSVEIKGYTDSVGTDQYNNLLSRKRAKMVMDYMNSRGVPSELMKAKAYGKDNPVADNGDPNQAWLNRRAEIIVHEK